jgi:hypothetical protein
MDYSDIRVNYIILSLLFVLLLQYLGKRAAEKAADFVINFLK